MKRFVLLATLVLAAACGTPVAWADDALKGDLAKVQGKWKGMMGREQNIPLVVEIQGQSTTVTIARPDNGGAVVLKGEIKLDDKASPKTWDWLKLTTPEGQELPENLGVYKLEGPDTIQFCNGGPGNPRPTEFKAGEEGAPSLLKLTRAGEDKVEGDLAKVQGKWKGMLGREGNVAFVMELKGPSATINATGPDGQIIMLKGEITLDEKASPKKWDWLKFKTPDGQELPDNLGIYKFDGDDLTICNGGPGNPRPTEFKAGEAGPPNLLKLSRVK